MRPKTIRLIESPVVEPVSLAEVKEQIGLSADQLDFDRMLIGATATARRLIERRLGVSLVATRYRAKYPAGAVVLELPNPPVLVDADHPLEITIDGEALGVNDYELEEDASEIELDSPAAEDVVVTYWAGVAPGQKIAPQLRSCILLYVAHVFKNREAVATDGAQPAEIPLAFETLLASESVTGVW
jgi:uncharacterized phiE125 gp8 family phage protein